MCTVTVVPHERGVRVLCNRDERRTRPIALPPQIHDLDGCLALFPVDPQGSGTWIGVNDANVIVTLLNVHGTTRIASERQRESHTSGPPSRRRRFGASAAALTDAEAGIVGPRERICRGATPASARSGFGEVSPEPARKHRAGEGGRDDAPPERTSRGLIVRELLHCVSLYQAIAAAENLDPRAFEPFQVVMVHENLVAIGTSDGNAPIRCTEGSLDRPLLFTSSSLGDAVVGPPRQRLFECMVVRSRVGWLAGQTDFHQHQWPHCPEISVRMERGDALTVSRTTVDITTRERRLVYEAPLDSAAPDRVRECCSLP